AGFQGLDALAAPVARIAEPIVWSTAMATSFGHTVAVAVLAFTIAAAALLSGKGAISRPSSFVAFFLAGLVVAERPCGRGTATMADAPGGLRSRRGDCLLGGSACASGSCFE
ncbi:MAG: hypothetical protein KK478_20115, partial [Ensifer alkalisoli]|nr:hypothetical protein [Sinorhizobium alkalisoli]